MWNFNKAIQTYVCEFCLIALPTVDANLIMQKDKLITLKLKLSGEMTKQELNLVFKSRPLQFNVVQ